MVSRLTLIVLTLFWVIMNVLLWRSEFGGRDHTGSSVPVGVVWQKMLTAPDNSPLEISHHGLKIGDCRWATVLGQSMSSSRAMTSDMPPEAMMEAPSDYRIDFEGSVALDNTPKRVRFDISVRFNTNHLWQDFRCRLTLRPTIWEIRSRVGEQAVHFWVQDESGRSERVLNFADLQNPEKIARQFELPLPVGVLGQLGQFGRSGSTNSLSLGLNWEARNDWMTIGHTSVRSYRLQARLFDRYQVVILVSPVGEILRVELPDNVVLANDQLNL
jgi:hypothetical protein